MKNYLSKYKFVVFLIILFILGIYFFNTENKNLTYTAKELKAIEIREYKGEDLSSVNDFRENSIKGPQFVDRENYELKILGLSNSISYAYEDVLNDFQPYEKVVTLDCVEGWSATILWKGILLKDLFDKENIPENINTVIFRAYDGYSTSFPLDYIADNNLIMAYSMNGLELPPERGFPFQLVAESKWGYKWIKWITEIEFSEDADYEGFWESRGYSNDGDLNKNFFD